MIYGLGFRVPWGSSGLCRDVRVKGWCDEGSKLALH